MPKVKDALKRLGLIDQIVSDRRRNQLTKEDLRKLVSEKMYGHPDQLSPSALDKDLQELRHNFGIVIHNNRRRGYFAETQHRFPDKFKEIWGEYIDFKRADDKLKKKQEIKTLKRVLGQLDEAASLKEVEAVKKQIKDRMDVLRKDQEAE